jgi:hypothetical protein
MQLRRFSLIVNLDDQRKCLWGLEDKSWELRHAEYPSSEAPPQPEPLPPFEEGMPLSEWIRIVADFSYAWLASFSAYLSSSFSLEERFGPVGWFSSLLDSCTSPFFSNLEIQYAI